MQKTPLFDLHVKAAGKIVEFAGWQMPVEYVGLREEHNCVRNNVGLFDVSHMGEIRLRGPKALQSLEWLTTNVAKRLGEGQAQYSLLQNESGGLVDDIIVYCIKPGTDYLLCVNASNTDKDFAWIVAHNRGAEVVNESSLWAQIAVQGPQSDSLLEKVFGNSLSGLKSFHIAEFMFNREAVLVARTGYTGERGVEIFVRPQQAGKLWEELLQKGQPFGVQPIGLGARDTLRTEMKYSLYGHEIDDNINPYAAGLGWVIKPKQKDFLGKEKILAGKDEAMKSRLVGFKMLDRGIPRGGYKLWDSNREIGHVTSGTLSPTLGENIGIGYVSQILSEPGSEFFVEIRSRKVKAQVVQTPFVQTKSSNLEV